MVLDERSRQTLMEHLPPTGWADVATKRDVDALAVAMRVELQGFEERVDLRFGALEEHMNHRLGRLEEQLNHRLGAIEERSDHDSK